MKGKKEAPHGGNRDRGKPKRVLHDTTDYTTEDFFEGLKRWFASKPAFELREAQ